MSLYGALDSHPFFPSHVASGRCFLSAAAAGAPAGVVSAFAEPRRWCAGAVLDVACAVCASAPSQKKWHPGTRGVEGSKSKNALDDPFVSQNDAFLGVGHPISLTGVCYAKDPQKGDRWRPRLRLI